MRAKDTYYFPHDYEPTSDPKIQALIGEFGASGYGIFWRIIEMLHSEQNHKLPFKKYVFLAIAKQMLTSAEQIQAIIDYCIEPCELFDKDMDYFWSNRVLTNINERAKLSEIRRIAGRAGAIAKQKLAKPSKGKEMKGNNKENNKENNIAFETFWNLYDKKKGDRNKCEAKWNKLNDDIRSKIIETLPAFISSIRDKQFQPYPMTYLNQERWNDETKISTRNELLPTDPRLISDIDAWRPIKK